jgi:retron-type reverse transcriptase
MAESLVLSVRRRRTLTKAWLAVQRNGRLSKSAQTRAEIKEFAKDAPVHLERIQRQLSKNTFVFKPAKGVKAKKQGKPGFRPLVIAPLESRIVQRAVHDVLLSVQGIESLVQTPYSFGGVKKSKGTDDELSSVPAAVRAVLEGIGSGGAYIARSDISKFFTRIPKTDVRTVIEREINEPAFIAIFDRAISAELSNATELHRDAKAFPTEDLGVAQGNSLSTLMGNILLKDFDSAMNSIPNIRCIRFIDDFVILGPNKVATIKAFEQAKRILAKWNMTLAEDKTEQGSTQQKFEFLGIEFNNGFLRPTKAARLRFLASVETLLQGSQQALIGYKTTGVIERRSALLKTLVTLSETVNAWGMSYRFCNDSQCLRQLDESVSRLVANYFSTYRSVRNALGSNSTWALLGIQSLEGLDRASFPWPKQSAKP